MLPNIWNFPLSKTSYGPSACFAIIVPLVFILIKIIWYLPFSPISIRKLCHIISFAKRTSRYVENSHWISHICELSWSYFFTTIVSTPAWDTFWLPILKDTALIICISYSVKRVWKALRFWGCRWRKNGCWRSFRNSCCNCCLL